jgi:hypothetical protein
MRINKSTRAKKSKSTSAKKAPLGAGAFGTRAAVAVVICFVGAAMIIGAASSSQSGRVARVDAPSDYATESPARKTTGAKTQAAAETAVAGTSGRDATEPATPVDPPMTIAPPAPPVTITGCLERDDDSFRLKNTSGAGAPKSRSWKSGFLKKGAGSVDVVDPPKKLRLTDHVGERVSLTGVLVDHEMQARTLHRVASSCN